LPCWPTARRRRSSSEARRWFISTTSLKVSATLPATPVQWSGSRTEKSPFCTALRALRKLGRSTRVELCATRAIQSTPSSAAADREFPSRKSGDRPGGVERQDGSHAKQGNYIGETPISERCGRAIPQSSVISTG